jgi:thiol:disulfide interchange protein
MKFYSMIASATSNRHTQLLSTIALVALAVSGAILGCKSNESASSSATAAPSTKPARTPVTPVPAVKKHLYSAEADPKTDIASALKQASVEHKRVILDFGGDWCGDCQVLDIYFHQSPNLELLDKNFVLVHVDIGRFDKNLDISKKYNVPLNKGVPALAVLDADGKLLYSQQAAEFGDMRYMYPASVTDFLNRWKT